MRLFIFLLVILALGECKPPAKSNVVESELDISGVPVNLDTTMTLAQGIQQTRLDSGTWALDFVGSGNQYFTLIGKHSSPIENNANEHVGLNFIQDLSQNKLKTTSGNPTCLGNTPWNSLIWIEQNKATGNVLFEKIEGDIHQISLNIKGEIVAMEAVQSSSGNQVYYLLVDENDVSQLYKMVRKKGNSEKHVTSFVYDLESSHWLPETQQNQVKGFGDYLADICVGSDNGSLFISALPRIRHLPMHGLIHKLSEAGEGDVSTYASCKPYIIHGENNFLSHARHLAYSGGNLWLTTSIPPAKWNTEFYHTFGNNSLMVIPGKGLQEGIPVRLVTAPPKSAFVGLILNAKKSAVYSWLVEQNGKCTLIEFKGETIQKLLE